MSSPAVASEPGIISKLIGSRSLTIGATVTVILVGVWPAPLTDVLQATVQHLVQQIAASKLPL